MHVEASSPFDQIYLAFDIHDVLAESKTDKYSAPLFQSSGMVLQLPMGDSKRPMRHYVYPFAKELFQILAETPNAHTAFFTSSEECIGQPFVEQLLLKSLGSEGYAKINDRISILARSRLRDGKSYHKDLYNPYCTFGNQKKDLDDVYPNSPKGQRILIDNDSSFAAPHQIKNLLNVSGFNWQEELLNYESYGFGLYYCLSQDELEKLQSKIKPGESIALFAKEDRSFVIIYHDKEGKKELELTPEESIQIHELHNQSILENSTFVSIQYPHKDYENKIIEEMKQLNLGDILSKKSCWLIDIMGGGVTQKKCEERASSGNIVIHLDEKDPIIYFPKKFKTPESLKNENYLKLLQLTTEYWKADCCNYFFNRTAENEASKAQLYDIIWDKVKDLVWKEKLIPKANHILLLTGAIFSAWEESKLTQKPISKILFNWQCSKAHEKKEFSPRVLSERNDLYLKGLEILRKVNPDLEPITIKTFEEAKINYPELPKDGAYEHNDGCAIS